MLRKGWSWRVHREGQIEASLIKKVMRKRAERLAGVQQRETITRGIQGTVRSTVWQDAGCRVDGGMVAAGQAQVTDGLLHCTRGLTCVSTVELSGRGETSDYVIRKVNMAAMQDGQLGEGSHFSSILYLKWVFSDPSGELKMAINSQEERILLAGPGASGFWPQTGSVPSRPPGPWRLSRGPSPVAAANTEHMRGAARGCALILNAGAGRGRRHSRCPETDLQVQGPMATRAPAGPPLQGQSVCLREPHTLTSEGTGWVGLPGRGAHGPPRRSGLEHAVRKRRARPPPHLTGPHLGSLFCLVSGLVCNVRVTTWLMILNHFYKGRSQGLRLPRHGGCFRPNAQALAQESAGGVAWC